MKHPRTFHAKYLDKAPDDPLPGQENDPPQPIYVDNEQEWPVEQILAARRYQQRLEYKVKWSGLEYDDTWYRTTEGQFQHAADIIKAFYDRYPSALGGPNKDRIPRPSGRPRRGHM